MKITADFGDSFNPNKIREQMKRAVRAKLAFQRAEELQITIGEDFSVTVSGPPELEAQAAMILKDAKL